MLIALFPDTNISDPMSSKNPLITSSMLYPIRKNWNPRNRLEYGVDPGYV